MKNAIEKAREGGYWKDLEIGQIEDGDGHGYYTPELALLDPLFWQALGKQQGWCFRSDHKEPWRLEWHRFIDHVAEGKDIDSFFNELLDNR